MTMRQSKVVRESMKQGALTLRRNGWVLTKKAAQVLSYTNHEWMAEQGKIYFGQKETGKDMA